MNFIMIYHFEVLERIKVQKVRKHTANLHDKNEYVTHIRNLREASNHGLVFKKNHQVIKFKMLGWDHILT